MNVDELINKLQNTLNKLIDENDLSVKTTELSNELLETIKILENCTSCKYKDKKIDGNDLDKIEYCLVELEPRKKEKFTIYILNEKIDKIDVVLKRIYNHSSNDKIVDILREVK